MLTGHQRGDKDYFLKRGIPPNKDEAYLHQTIFYRQVGSREDVTSSNQDIKTNVATLVCKEECEVHVLSFVVCFCLRLP